MLKMIIADDESIVRNGLKKIIKWDELGIEIIAEASDGQQTFDLCRELNPDILFTDIRMPMMDGLEVAMKLEEHKQDIRVVFLSGIQDFNYAKTALDIKADGYVLKPVNIEELKDVMQRVVTSIKMERARKSELINLKKQLHENFPVIRESFLKNLIHGVYRNEAKIQDKIQYFKIPISTNENLLVAVLQIDDYNKVIENDSEEDKQLISFSISNIIEEIMSTNNSGVSCCLNENEFVLIFNENAQKNGKHFEICESIISCLNKFLHISVSIGLGSKIYDISSIFTSYKDAHTALQYKFYTGKNSLLDIDDIIKVQDFNLDNVDSSVINENSNRLMRCIQLGDCEQTLQAINCIFQELYSHPNIPIDYVQSLCVELVCVASRTIKDLGLNPNEITDKQSIILESIYNKESAYDLKNYISEIFSNMAQYFSKKYNQKNTTVINKIKDIIEKRYNDDISVSKISEEVYLTPNYISMIFKQETGETITEYITKVRMEKAKKMLKLTDLKIMEIAEKVGYEDPHYFSKVFKKYTGIHPQKYRSEA